MGDKGLELSPVTIPKTLISQNERAKSGAPNDKIAPELAWVIDAWPSLPEQVKTKINELIELETKLGDSRCPFLCKLPGQKQYIRRIQDSKPEVCREYPVSKEQALEDGCFGLKG